MSVSDNKIRKTDKYPSDVVRSPGIHHPACRVLRDGGVISIGIDERYPYRQWGEAFTPSHLLFYALTGRVMFPEADASAGPGQLIVMPNQFAKDLSTDADGFTGVFVHLDSDSWQSLSGDPWSVFDINHCPLMYQLTEELTREVLNPEGAELCNQLCRLILFFLRKDLLSQQDPLLREQELRLTSVWQRVRGELNRDWSVTELSRLAGMSEGHFHRTVKQHYRQSPGQVLVRFRMERAMDLLRTTSWGLDFISQEVGYTTAYAFSNAFRRFSGVRPGAYRKRAL
jgi:AraC-like DNA-binding protein